MRAKNRLIILALIVLVGGILFFLISQEEQITLPVQKKIVIPQSVEIVEEALKKVKTEVLEDVKKEVLEKKVKSKQMVTFYAVREVNTTIATEIRLKSEVDEDGKKYKYIWKKNENIVGFGRNIKIAFPLGEHNLTCQTLDESSGLIIAKESINVTAWRYTKEERYYFDTSTDKYYLGETKLFNYLKQLVLIFSNYYKKEFSHNEYGKIIEERYENFNDEKDNYTITNSYDGENLLSIEVTDDEGNILESLIYDEEGKEIVQEISEESLNVEEDKPIYSHIQKKPIKIYNKEGNLTHMESANGQYIKNMKYENGRLSYRETIYPKGKNIQTLQYNEDGREVYREYLRLDTEENIRGKDIVTKAYDDDGNLIKKERKYSIKEIMFQHTLEKWSYKDGKKITSEIEAFVGVCPCTDNIVKEKSTYYYDKNGTFLSSDYQYQREGDNEFKKLKESKTVKTYSNSLE